MYNIVQSMEEVKSADWARSIISSHIFKFDKTNKGYLAQRKECQYYAYALAVALSIKYKPVSLSEILDKVKAFNPVLAEALRSSISEEVLSSMMDDFYSNINLPGVQSALISVVNSDLETVSDDNTPASIVELAMKLLDIKDGEEVVDIGSGNGLFLLSAATKHPNSKFTGFEVSSERVFMSLMRIHVNELKNVEIIQNDAFDHSDDRRYSKVFANYPFNMKLRFSGMASDLKNSCRWDGNWAFNELVRNMVCWAPQNKGIAIMPMGSTFSSSKSEVVARKAFIDMGVIESVITLPPRLFEYTGVQVAMLVISFGHESIRFVDASDVFTPGRRSNYLSEADIERIVHAYEQDSDISRSCSYEEIAWESYCLTPSRYLTHKSIEIENGVPFGKIIDSVTRGAQLPAAELDELASIKETPYQYLMVSNIKDGIISQDLPYLSKLDKSLLKYCIEDGDIIMSKNGAPYKVAVAHPNPEKRILANGNMFVIKLDSSKANPVYVKAFLESERGVESLKRISMGSIVPNLSLTELKKVLIPLPSLEEQNKLAERYTEQLNKIEILKIKLDRAISELGGLFDDRT